MTNVPQLTPPALVTPPAEAPSSGGWSLRRILIVAVGGLFGVFALLFIVALLLSGVSDVEGIGSVVRLARDLVIIFLALEGALIVLALAVLILQIARLVNLIQTEVKPILENTQETLKTARGTVEFMSGNITQPLVRAGGFFAALSVMLNSVFGLRRAVKKGHIATDDLDEPLG
ncbi:MAG: hypothetical protein SGI73_11770 [Chloroflexota bacterium]|nr:hypothetical protein [Chloroflexota bacterium]